MTNESKHTPGPWRYVRANPSPTTGEHLIAGAKPGYLAEVRDCGSGDVEANARLIAAAPDLRDALRLALPHLEAVAFKDNAAYALARAALAKLDN